MKGNEMTRLTLSLALWLATQAAWGQVDFGAQCTPQQRTAALKASYDASKPGDTIQVPAGVYEAADFPPVPAGVTVKGAGVGRTIFQSPRPLLVDRPDKPDQATTFEPGDGCTLDGIEFQYTGPKSKQAAVLGFGTPSDKPRRFTARNCKVTGGQWSAYNWHGQGNVLTFENCEFITARVGITGGVSSGADAQTITIKNCRIKLDVAQSDYGIPWTGQSVSHNSWGGQVGLLMRGGKAFVEGLTVEALGPPPGTGPRVCAITDWLDLSSATQTVIEVSGLKTKLTKNGAVELFDIDCRYGVCRMKDSFGTGKGGSLSISTLPPLTK